MTISRRDLLKLGAASLACLAARPARITPPSIDLPFPIAMGRITTEMINVYTEPYFRSERVGRRKRDQVVSLLAEVTAEKGPAHNPRWYRLVEGYSHSGYIQRVDLHPANQLLDFDHLNVKRVLSEVTVPYTRSYRRLRPGSWERLYRLYYHSLHWIYGIDEGPDGKPWYRLRDHLVGVEYHAPTSDLRPIFPDEYSPISAEVPPGDKSIRLSISQQTLTAIEAGQVVHQFQVATGVRSPEKIPEDQLPTDTPLGRFRIQSKMPSRHMGDGKLTDDIEAYELPGVPWAMFFTQEGVALHGCYWHDNFGVRMSHGCVNMRNEDAKWLFRWTDPVFTGEDFYVRKPGTYITISD
jgi:hypothetical protein